MTDTEFLARYALLKRLGLVALAGAAVLAVAALLVESRPMWASGLGAVGALGVVPAFFYLIFLSNWKARYRGTHSNLWGAVLVIETSGWFKLVYLFRHLIPDARGTGRYRRPG